MVIWAASTITFFVPRMSARNAIRERFAQLARTGGFSPGRSQKIIASMQHQFGLDRPLLAAIRRLHLAASCISISDISLGKYPATVTGLIQQALPWTIGLILVTTILSFVIGTLLGAIAAWPRAPQWARAVATPFVLFMGVPPVLMGVLLLFFVGFQLNSLPLGGAYSIGIIPELVLELRARHGRAPDSARPVADPGLGRRLGAVHARHGHHHPGRGLRDLRRAQGAGRVRICSATITCATRWCPQVTGLALALGTVVTSTVIVEGIFGLPGIGTLLNDAIQSNDFPVIYGIVIFITIAVATLMVAWNSSIRCSIRGSRTQ